MTRTSTVVAKETLRSKRHKRRHDRLSNHIFFVANQKPRKMSKISTELLETSISNIKKFAAGEKITVSGEEKQGKLRKFVETIGKLESSLPPVVEDVVESETSNEKRT